MNRQAKILALIAACALASSCTTLTMQPTRAPNAMDTSMSSYREANADRYIIVTMTDALHEQLIHGERVDREELPPLYAGFLSNLARTYGLRRVADWPLSSLSIRCFVFEAQDAARRDATIAALSRERFVESAQRMSTYFTTSSVKTESHDPYLNLQHGFAEMDVGDAQRWATGKSVKVAVIDTGLDTQHPELKQRVTGIRNFVDRDTRAFNSDIHGTAIAGVIGAASGNGIGLVGVAPDADLLGFKACWQQAAQDRNARCSTFTLAKAVNFAIDQNVDIINLSLGGPPDPLLTRLVNKAIERNIIVIGAVSPDYPGGFPAGVPGVIAVANGRSPEVDSKQMVNAPGNQVLSTKPQREYDFYSGSSLSAAHITGLAALIRQRKPHLAGNLVKELIVTTAEPDSHAANACRALARVVEGGGDCSPRN